VTFEASRSARAASVALLLTVVLEWERWVDFSRCVEVGVDEGVAAAAVLEDLANFALTDDHIEDGEIEGGGVLFSGSSGCCFGSGGGGEGEEGGGIEEETPGV
jgi:hypothetical protein